MFQIPSPSETALKMIFKVKILLCYEENNSNNSKSLLYLCFQAIVQGFLSKFVPSIKDLTNSIVNAATEIYDRISVDLLPTPAKSHYVFNLRDLSKCIQGTLQADPSSFRENIQILRLFYHECLRVFHDRLINKEDKSYFYYLMREVRTLTIFSPIFWKTDFFLCKVLLSYK